MPTRGGGIYGGADVGTINLEGGVMEGNFARDSGGGIYDEYKLNVTGGVIRGNEANNIGGGIYTRENTFSVRDVTISGNSAFGGGGIYFDGNSRLTIGSGTVIGGTDEVDGNTAKNYGGGIHVKTGSAITINKGVTISSNATYAGGAFDAINATSVLIAGLAIRKWLSKTTRRLRQQRVCLFRTLTLKSITLSFQTIRHNGLAVVREYISADKKHALPIRSFQVMVPVGQVDLSL